MSQPIHLASLTAPLSAGYEQPFAMLAACHERVQRMLRLLARLQAHVASAGADEQARHAARDVMRYFDQAAPQHHLDEERHVFPAVFARGDPETVSVVRRLLEEHRLMEDGWQSVRQILEALASGSLDAIDDAQCAEMDRFAALYDSHIDAEESVAYPCARKALDEAALAAMTDDMMRRRGVR